MSDFIAESRDVYKIDPIGRDSGHGGHDLPERNLRKRKKDADGKDEAEVDTTVPALVTPKYVPPVIEDQFVPSTEAAILATALQADEREQKDETPKPDKTTPPQPPSSGISIVA